MRNLIALCCISGLGVAVRSWYVMQPDVINVHQNQIPKKLSLLLFRRRSNFFLDDGIKLAHSMAKNMRHSVRVNYTGH